MSWTQRQSASSHDSITTYDAAAVGAGAQTAAAMLSCNDEMVVLLTAVAAASTFIQAPPASATGGNVSSLALAFAMDNTAGNTLIVDCGWGGIIAPQAHAITISDTQGNTYISTPAVGGGTVRQGVAGGNTLGVTFVALNCKAGPNTVTVTIDSGATSTSATLAIHEYLGGSAVDGDLSFDGSTHQSNAGAATNVGGGTATATQTTTSAGDLLHMAVFISSACAGSPSNPSGGGNPPPIIFNGWTVITAPLYPPAPKSIEMNDIDIVGASTSPFTAQQQFYDWQQARMEWSVEWPLISPSNWPAWSAFLALLRGNLNVFRFGDPTHLVTAGSGAGSPVVNGANQSGFSLMTSGWQPNAQGALLPGDWIQIGYRLYRNTGLANADGSGNATLGVWPNLRDGGPTNGAALVLANTQGLWRLRAPARKHMVSVANSRYFAVQLDLREAL